MPTVFDRTSPAERALYWKAVLLILAAPGLLCLSFSQPSWASKFEEGILGKVDGREILLDDYLLFVRHHRPTMKEKSQIPSPRELVESFAVSLVLASSYEASDPDFLDRSDLKWKLWDLEAGEAYSRILEEVVGLKISLSEEELRTYYDQHPEKFTREAGFIFRNVFLDSTRCPDQAAHEELAHKAQQTRSELETLKTIDGTIPVEDFQRIAAKAMDVLTGEIKARGPFRPGQIKPSLESTLLDLKPGQISDVIQTENGYYILWLESKTTGGVEPFDQAAPEVEKELSYEIRKQRFDEYRKPLLTADHLRVYDEGLANLVRWATNPDDAENALLAQTGNFRLPLLEYLDYLKTSKTAPLPNSSDSPEKIREFHSATVRNHLLFGAAVFEDAIARGLTQDATYLNRVRVGKIAILGKEGFLQLLTRRVDSLDPVTEEEVRSYYEEHPGEFMTEPKSRYREIAVRPEEATGAYRKELAFRAAEDRAMELLGLIQSGSPEEEVIKRFSQGEEADRGGLTNWLVPGTRFSPPMWKELETLEPGEWTREPYRLRGKATLLKLEDLDPPELLPLESCRGRILESLATRRLREVTQQITDEILNTSGFEVDSDKLRDLPPIKVD